MRKIHAKIRARPGGGGMAGALGLAGSSRWLAGNSRGLAGSSR